jgi:hypothetical protein
MNWVFRLADFEFMELLDIHDADPLACKMRVSLAPSSTFPINIFKQIALFQIKKLACMYVFMYFRLLPFVSMFSIMVNVATEVSIASVLLLYSEPIH